MLSSKAVQRLFERLLEATPNPAIELTYTNPFTLLVAVVLSAQATDVGVNKATKTLFLLVDSPEKMIALGEESLRQYVRSIGLYPTKSRHIIQLSKLLIERHNGQVPGTREELEALPGVGRKTANVMLNVIFGKPVIPVDTHVTRVSHRTGLTEAKLPYAIETELMHRVPDQWKKLAHHLLVLHGRHTCKARRPLCGECPIRDICEYPHKTS